MPRTRLCTTRRGFHVNCLGCLYLAPLSDAGNRWRDPISVQTGSVEALRRNKPVASARLLGSWDDHDPPQVQRTQAVHTDCVRGAVRYRSPGRATALDMPPLRWWPSGLSTILSAMIRNSRPARSLTVLLLGLPLAAHSSAWSQDPAAGAPGNQDPATPESVDPAADSRAGTEQQPEQGGDGQKRPALELSVLDAMRIANNNTLDLLAAEVGTEMSNYDQLGSWGAFDWIFDASASYTDATTQGSSFLAGGDQIETKSQTVGLNLLKPLTTGGSFQVNFNHNIRDSNNAFFNDPQQTTDNLSLSYVQPLRRGAWSKYATAVQRETEMFFLRQVEVQRLTRQTVDYNVTLAFWELVRTREQSTVAD